MMYHFIFGLVTVSTGPLVFCSSSIIKVPKPSGASLVVKHPLVQRLVQNQVNSPEIQSEKKNCDDDHKSRRSHFLEAGKSNLAHFIANIREEPFNACRRGLQPAAQALIVAYRCCCFRHETLLSLLKNQLSAPSSFVPAFLVQPPKSQVPRTYYYPSKNPGRGGGIRTPKSGFGDRQFNR